MNRDDHEGQTFLQELYNLTQGDTEAQVSMYDVGSNLGLEKSDAGALAEELIVEGLAELVSLSGGICITPEGMKALNIHTDDTSSDGYRLSNDKILTETDRAAIVELIDIIRKNEVSTSVSLGVLEDVVIDLKTIDVQLLSSTPKTAIIRAVLTSLLDSFSTAGNHELSAKIEMLLG